MSRKMFVTLNTLGERYNSILANAHNSFAVGINVPGVKMPTVGERKEWGFEDGDLAGSPSDQYEWTEEYKRQPLFLLTDNEKDYSLGAVEVDWYEELTGEFTRSRWETILQMLRPPEKRSRFNSRKRIFDRMRERGIRAIGRLRGYDWVCVFVEEKRRGVQHVLFQEWGIERLVDIEPLYHDNGAPRDPFFPTIDWPFSRAKSEDDSEPFDTDSELARELVDRYAVTAEDLGKVIDFSDPRTAIPAGDEPIVWRRRYFGGRRCGTVGEVLSRCLADKKAGHFFVYQEAVAHLLRWAIGKPEDRPEGPVRRFTAPPPEK